MHAWHSQTVAQLIRHTGPRDRQSTLVPDRETQLDLFARNRLPGCDLVGRLDRVEHVARPDLRQQSDEDDRRTDEDDRRGAEQHAGHYDEHAGHGPGAQRSQEWAQRGRRPEHLPWPGG